MARINHRQVASFIAPSNRHRLCWYRVWATAPRLRDHPLQGPLWVESRHRQVLLVLRLPGCRRSLGPSRSPAPARCPKRPPSRLLKT